MKTNYLNLLNYVINSNLNFSYETGSSSVSIENDFYLIIKNNNRKLYFSITENKILYVIFDEELEEHVFIELGIQEVKILLRNLNQ